jgi:transposase
MSIAAAVQHDRVVGCGKIENISEATLYNWRKHVRSRGCAVPGPKPDNTYQRSAEAKLATVIETAPMSETQLKY